MIYVERDSQKGIIIGHQGIALKKVNTELRKALEKFFLRTTPILINFDESFQENFLVEEFFQSLARFRVYLLQRNTLMTNDNTLLRITQGSGKILRQENFPGNFRQS